MNQPPLIQNKTNTILGGKIQLIQPITGYRASIDSIFLGASVEQKRAAKSQTLLDIGTGSGAALLAAAHRLKNIKGIGLEFQRDMVRLAVQNIKNNNFQNRLEAMQGDLLLPPPRLAASSFDHVMANPPYYESEISVESPFESKATSNHDKGITLNSWIDFAYKMVKPRGYVHFVFTTARLDDLINALYGGFGDITIFPLWQKKNRESKRVIVRARKNVQSPSKILPGILVHEENGDYTQESQDILTNSKGLNWGC